MRAAWASAAGPVRRASRPWTYGARPGEALCSRRPGTGQQGAGPVRITREGRLLGRRREPGRAQGRAGGERGGAAEGGGAFAVRVRGGRGRLQPGGEHGVRAGSGAGELDEGGERKGVAVTGGLGGSARQGGAVAGVRRADGPFAGAHRRARRGWVAACRRRRGCPVTGLRQQGGQQLMGGAATGGRGVVQDRAGEQRVAEVDPAARPLEEPLGGGRAEQGAVQEVPGQPGPGAGAQQEQGIGPGAGGLVLLGGGGQQEQRPGVRGKPVEAVRVRGQHPLGAGQRTGQRGAPGQLVRGEAAGEPGEEARVPGRLPEQLGADDRVESPRDAGKPWRATAGAVRPTGHPLPAPRKPVQQRGGRVPVQRAQPQCGQSGEGGDVVGRDQDGDPAAGAQPAGREGEGGAGGRVPGVGVVGADQQRAGGAPFP
ncbi:hypothetical protein SCYAM73S_02727 [Streptomyces cyaneofuscatus]